MFAGVANKNIPHNLRLAESAITNKLFKMIFNAQPDLPEYGVRREQRFYQGWVGHEDSFQPNERLYAHPPHLARHPIRV